MAAAIGALAGVVLLWWLMRGGWLAAFDRGLLVALSPAGVARRLAFAATWMGDTPRRMIVLALAAGVLLVARRARSAAALVGIVLGGTAANSLVKWIVARPRPDLLPHLDQASGHSFPSGHAAGAMVLYGALALVAPPRHRPVALAAAGAIAAAIGLSRVMLAVHWPSDVAAGWLLGLAWLLACRRWLGGAVDRR